MDASGSAKDPVGHLSSTSHSTFALTIQLLPNGCTPTRATASSAGWDLYAPADGLLLPGQTKKVYLNFKIQIPVGYSGLVLGRSSMALKSIFTHPGLIDPDYGGNVAIILQNTGSDTFYWKSGHRLGQLLFTPNPSVTWVEDIVRGSRGGFGSSGL